MDWKSFIASVVGSLAWPAVIVALLIILREQVRGLAERLQELTLPGGAKATFEKRLESARDEAEQLPVRQLHFPATRLPSPGDEGRFLELAEAFPEAAVLEMYKEVEGVIPEIAKLLGMESTVPPILVIRQIRQRKLVSEATYELFRNLREARNAAVHASDGKRISPGEALDYREQATKLLDALNFAIDKLKREGGDEPAPA